MGLVSLFLLLPRCHLRIRAHGNYTEMCYRPNTAFLGRAWAIKSPHTFPYKAPFPSTAGAGFCPRSMSYLGLDLWVRLWCQTLSRGFLLQQRLCLLQFCANPWPLSFGITANLQDFAYQTLVSASKFSPVSSSHAAGPSYEIRRIL